MSAQLSTSHARGERLGGVLSDGLPKGGKVRLRLFLHLNGFRVARLLWLLLQLALPSELLLLLSSCLEFVQDFVSRSERVACFQGAETLHIDVAVVKANLVLGTEIDTALEKVYLHFRPSLLELLRP